MHTVGQDWSREHVQAMQLASSLAAEKQALMGTGKVGLELLGE